MKNIIFIHGLGGLEKEKYFDSLKSLCSKLGMDVIIPSLGGYRNQITYTTWRDYFDKYILDKINNHTILVAQSIGTQFAVKYLVEKNITVGAYVSTAGPLKITKFKKEIVKGRDKQFVISAKSFKLTNQELLAFKKLPFVKFAFYSNDDNFFKQKNLADYGKAIGAKVQKLDGYGHFAKTKVKEVEELVTALIKPRQLVQCIQNENVIVKVEDTITAIKKAGFDGAFVQWYNKNWLCTQQEQVDICNKIGLKIEFAHLGYDGINNIWLKGNSGDKLLSNYIDMLDNIKKNNINLVIMHLLSGTNPPKPTKLGLKRLQKIVDYAEKFNIKIAFENTRKNTHFEYVLKKIKNNNAGVCFDAGHYHCYYKDDFDWSLCKNKILAIHLHDNNGEEDEHLLPYDGNMDWNYIINQLNAANYIGPITLESCYRNNYLEKSLEEFYKKSCLIANKLRDIIENK